MSHLLYHDRLNRTDLAELMAPPGPPLNWRRLAYRGLASGTKDWTGRLTGQERDG